MNPMLAPLLVLLIASPEVAHSALPPAQTQEQKQAPKPHPEVQKLIDEATGEQPSHEKRIPILEKALSRAREIRDIPGEARALFWLGRINQQIPNREKALELLEDCLPLFRGIGDVAFEGMTLDAMGSVWSKLGDIQKALKCHEEALPLRRRARDAQGEAATLNNLAVLWSSLGERRKAVEYLEQALIPLRQLMDSKSEGLVLNNIGAVYLSLGEKRKALSALEKSLPLLRKTGDLEGEIVSLGNIGRALDELGERHKALEQYELALVLIRKTGNVRSEATIINNIGLVWLKLGEARKALDFLEQSLPLLRKTGNIPGEARTLTSLAGIWSDLGDNDKAVKHLTESLPLFRKSGDLFGEAWAQHNMGLVWKELAEPCVAINWLKCSVNAHQRIRAGSAGLSAATDRALLTTIRLTYDTLTELLESQGRIAEALQVQELQEASRIKEFVYRGTPEEDMFAKRLSLTRLEMHWMEQYDGAMKRLGELGKQRDDLARMKERLPEQEKALQDVNAKLKDAEANFKKTIDGMTEAFKEAAPEDHQLVDLAKERDLTLVAKALSDKTGKKVGCFATLVGEKSTSVMFIGPNAKVVTKTIAISRADLSKAVTAALGDLNNAKRQPFATSKKLYDLVIKPFEAQLKGLDCVMFNLNGPLRYVPMAALWDGKRYLAERFQVTNFSIAVWENLAKNPPKSWGAAFFGLTQKVEGFSQLPGVKAEVEASAPLFKATPRLDKAFSKSALEALLKQKKTNLLHFGTHFALDPASSEETYMVLGDGTKWRPTEMEQNKQLSLEGVELLVAGACRTGVPTGDDASIEGFGAYCQVKGARSVLSTLWEVNDASTSTWMKTFYKLLAGGKGRGEAFHRAQLAMITGQVAAALKLPKGGTRAGSATAATAAPGKPYVTDPKRPYAHPYYWAPFTLSGNWR